MNYDHNDNGSNSYLKIKIIIIMNKKKIIKNEEWRIKIKVKII